MNARSKQVRGEQARQEELRLLGMGLDEIADAGLFQRLQAPHSWKLVAGFA